MVYRKKTTDEDIAKLHIKSLKTETLKKALEFINILTEWKSADKLYSTYFEGTQKALNNTGNGRIYFDYRLEGTVTGRLSCGAYKASKEGKEYPLGLSFHTLPRDKEDGDSTSIRQICIVEDGYDFITGDFKAMELRVLAHIAKEKNMIKAFHSGEDLHKYTASLIYEKAIDKITKEERQIAKSISFLVVYGGGAWKLSKTANISLAIAERTIAKFQEIYPGVFEWMDKIKDEIYSQHYTTSIFGRRRNLPDIISPVQKIQDRCIRQGVNFVIQSSASDIVCYCVLDIAKEFKLRGMESSIIGTVHDSIEVRSPKSETEEALQIMYHKMTSYPLLKHYGYFFSVPIEVELEVGRSFSGGNKVEFSKKGSIVNRSIL